MHSGVFCQEIPQTERQEWLESQLLLTGLRCVLCYRKILFLIPGLSVLICDPEVLTLTLR